ncbi:MAG: DNRLRE domain-containing protein [Verrucomicrobiota bacterium]
MHPFRIRSRIRARALAAFLACATFARAADYNLAINYATDLGAVSPMLIGTNAIYCNEPDAQWGTSGNIPTLLSNVATGIVRYPAGTVTTFYHWTNPHGQGWADSWDPAFNPANNKPTSATMSIDEYLDYATAKGIEPLVGINMGSGKRFNRVTDGINEAKALVQHCVNRGANVKYYYLDNEPYQSDANYPYTPSEYAAQINLYAPALRTIDPNIKIIANLHPGVTQMAWNRTVIQQAGANIDYVDIHMYWRHGNATFANWIAEPKMKHQQQQPFSEQRTIFRTMFAEEGHPAIELAALEWNVGPNGTGAEPTEAESALMAAEQFMQYIQSGLKMACFWPLHWESGGSDWHRATISSAQGYTPNKVYDMFQQFATIPWRMQVSNTLSGSAAQDRLCHVSIKTNDAKTLYIYLINKNQAAPTSTVDLDLTAFTGFNAQSAVGFESTDNSVGPLNVHPITVTKTGTHVTFSMPKNSFAKVTVSRPAPTVTLTFAPVKDAMVKAAAATSNFGTASNVQISGQSGFAKHAYLQFNVTGIPAGATVTSASLLLASQTTGTSRPVAAHTVANTTWTETGITWNTKPGPLSATLSTVSSHTSGADSSWNVTNAVTGNANLTFVLDSTFSGDTNFHSREAGATNEPSLVVIYQP